MPRTNWRAEEHKLTLDLFLRAKDDGGIDWTSWKCNIEEVLTALIVQRAGHLTAGADVLLKKAHDALDLAYRKECARSSAVEYRFEAQAAIIKTLNAEIEERDRKIA